MADCAILKILSLKAMQYTQQEIPMQSKETKNTYDDRRYEKYSGTDTLVMAISLFIVVIFLFSAGPEGNVLGVNDIFNTVQLHGL